MDSLFIRSFMVQPATGGGFLITFNTSDPARFSAPEMYAFTNLADLMDFLQRAAAKEQG